MTTFHGQFLWLRSIPRGDPGIPNKIHRSWVPSPPFQQQHAALCELCSLHSLHACTGPRLDATVTWCLFLYEESCYGSERTSPSHLTISQQGSTMVNWDLAIRRLKIPKEEFHKLLDLMTAPSGHQLYFKSFRFVSAVPRSRMSVRVNWALLVISPHLLFEIPMVLESFRARH